MVTLLHVSIKSGGFNTDLLGTILLYTNE